MNPMFMRTRKDPRNAIGRKEIREREREREECVTRKGENKKEEYVKEYEKGCHITRENIFVDRLC